jgi:organic hydroperoxide reductase OsmC/OhrA
MHISALIENGAGGHQVSLTTGGREHSLPIPPKTDGLGSSINGGELLFLALATCYCNDIYREARQRGVEVRSVEVEVSGEFGGEGEAARAVTYRAKVAAKAPRGEIIELMRHTDSVAEIQNTLRRSTPVVLAGLEAEEV